MTSEWIIEYLENEIARTEDRLERMKADLQDLKSGGVHE